MAGRAEMIAFLDDLLDPEGWEDYAPNGLQVVGASEVSVVATAVSAHLELFERAAAEGAQLLLCHHGLFWRSQPRTVGPQLRARLKTLFDADMSLAAYHLPLDAHPEVGNNVLICRTLGLVPERRFGEAAGREIGFVGRAPEPVSPVELVDRCRRAFGRDPLVFGGREQPVETVGVVSGGGAGSLEEAIALGLDALITGEPSEPAMADARENDIAFIAGGHYATETFGVQRLGDLLADRFGVEHRFIEVPNPV